MNYVIIYPARYGSVRFPDKPEAVFCGKPLIQRVYRNAVNVTPDMYVATDDKKMQRCC